jgi:membrane-associated phospholipid phosphatase
MGGAESHGTRDIDVGTFALSSPPVSGPGARLSRYLGPVSEIRLSTRARLLCLALFLIQLLLFLGVKYEHGWLTAMDLTTAQTFNRFAQANPGFERQMVWVQYALLIKTLPFLMLVVWCWFASRERPETDRLRSQIAAGLGASFAAVALVMAVQKLVGHRLRPMFQPDYSFITFFDFRPNNDVSSFPSDTSGLVFGLCTTAYLFNRRVGLAAFAFAVVAVALPRLMTGMHFASDIVFSALAGIVLVILATALAPLIRAPMVHLLERYKAVIYALTFGFLFEAGRMGGDLRPLLNGIIKALLS